jgi:glutathione S-transferase
MFAEETQPSMRDGIQKAHRNFLRDAVYLLYENNRVAEAAEWYRYLARKYPDDPTLNGDPNSRPSQLTFEQYAIARVQEDVGDTSQERTTAAVEGLLTRAYYELAIGQDDRYAGFKLLAGKVYENYQVLNRLLDTQQGMPYAMRAVVKTVAHFVFLRQTLQT